MDIPATLARHGYEPKAFLDQHFLDDEKLVLRLMQELDVDKDDVVFEIGPGIGTFTSEIPRCKEVIAVDIDPDVIAILRKEVSKSYVHIQQGDALAMLDELTFTKLISSTPYTICEPLFRKLLSIDFERAVVIVPNAFSGTIRDPSTVLGFNCSLMLGIKPLELISREKFFPRPRVDSMALLITRKPSSTEQEIYLQRDKKVKNALREILAQKGLTKKQAKERILGRFSFEDRTIQRLKAEELQEIKDFITSSE